MLYLHACVLYCVYLLYGVNIQKIPELNDLPSCRPVPLTTPGNRCWWACHDCLAMIILYILIPSHT